jgi:hypothetical protein
MKHHLLDMHIAGPVSHTHSFFHRHSVAERWTAKHTVLASWALTCLFFGLIAGFLIMFETYQLTGIWPLFGR